MSRYGEIGRKSFTFKYTLRDAVGPEIVHASGESVQVSFDYKANKSRPIPEELAKKIQRYVEKKRFSARRSHQRLRRELSRTATRFLRTRLAGERIP